MPPAAISFSRVRSDRIGGSGPELCQVRFRLDIGKNVFVERLGSPVLQVETGNLYQSAGSGRGTEGGGSVALAAGLGDAWT